MTGYAAVADGKFETERRGVGEGWQPIILTAHENLVDLLGDYDLLQIKEKFGGLRYYMSAPAGCDVRKVEQIRDIIDTAERQSFETCEVCGRPGEATGRGVGWIKTLCPLHTEERLAERRRINESFG